MITYKQGNLLDQTEGILVHGVNCRGYMGAGVAKAVRAKYNMCYLAYIDECAKYSPTQLIGTCFFYRVNPKLIVANLFSQIETGPDARLMAVVSGLVRVKGIATELGLPVHMVKIGCGIGGLAWGEVSVASDAVFSSPPSIEVTVWDL